ncbi:MAG TPA: CoA-binding protein [Campylobacterales bacterium]|nr:CoA-binding protein [Campylobacterales bacterium]HIP60210.1 CoA-binding protein [Campylobacterales bacterium]
MECEFPTVNENMDEIKEIFKSVKTIAIPGLSPKEDKDSHRVAKYLQEQGYKIIPIYPKEETILGEKVYRSLADVTEQVDMVDMFRKAAVADEIVDVIAKRDDIKVLWLQKGIVNNGAAKRAKDLGLKVVQNRCTMVDHRVINS